MRSICGRSATRFGAGDLAARVPETRLVEIASTARAFNTMATNLEQRAAHEAARPSGARPRGSR